MALTQSDERDIVSVGATVINVYNVCYAAQVVQVCAEHKKPAKLAKHLQAIKAKSETMRNPPRVLVFANRVKVRPSHLVSYDTHPWNEAHLPHVCVVKLFWFALARSGAVLWCLNALKHAVEVVCLVQGHFPNLKHAD